MRQSLFTQYALLVRRLLSDYITWLRSRIGTRKTLLAYTTALIRDDQGRALFQQRADFKDEWWGLPGGLLELGESFTACAQREVWEETGYHVEPVRLSGLYASPGRRTLPQRRRGAAVHGSWNAASPAASPGSTNRRSSINASSI
jgi:8-oxo-dGTP pyrophosphatase MutT (NUDIX family)